MRDADRGDGGYFYCKSGTLADVRQLRPIGLGAGGSGARQGGDRRGLGGDLAGAPLRGWPQRLGHAFQLAHDLTKSARQSSLSAPRPEARQQPCNLPQSGQSSTLTGSDILAVHFVINDGNMHTHTAYIQIDALQGRLAVSTLSSSNTKGHVCSLLASSASVQSKQMLCPAARHTHAGRFEGFSSQQASMSSL